MQNDYLCGVLALFRNADILTSLLLLLWAAASRPFVWFYPELIAPVEMSGAGALYRVLFVDWAPAPMQSAIAAAFLIFVQALLINRICDRFRLMPDRNWIPGAVYVLLRSLLGQSWQVSPVMLGATFLPIMYMQAFSTYKVVEANGRIFNSGFVASLAALFFAPAIWWVLGGYVILHIMRKFSLREQAVWLSGVFTPLYLGALIFWIWDQGKFFVQAQFVQDWGWGWRFDWQALDVRLSLIVWGVLLGLAILGYGLFTSRQLIHAKKCFNALYWMLLIGALSWVGRRDTDTGWLLLVAPSLSVLLSLALQRASHRAIAEMAFFLLFSVAITIQFYFLWP